MPFAPVRSLRRATSSTVRTVLSSTVVAFVIKVASAGLSFVMFAALARAMEPDAYGRFAAAFSLTTFLATAASVGQRGAALKWVSAHAAVGAARWRAGAMRVGYGVVLIGGLVVASGVLVAATLGVEGLGRLEVATAVGILVLALAEYQGHVFRASGGIPLALLPRDVLWRASVVGLAAWAVFTGATWSPATWLLAVMGLLAAWAGGQFVVHERRHPDASPRTPAAFAWRRWVPTWWGFWAASVLVIAAGSWSVVAIERWVGPEQAAGFFVALRTAQLLNLFVLASKVVTMPAFSRLVELRDWPEVQRVASASAWLSGAFALVGFGAFVALGGWLLSAFGAEFRTWTPELWILAAGFVVSAAAGPTEALLQMGGRERGFVVVLAVAHGVSVASLAVTIPAFGTLGAACSVASGSVLIALLGRAFALRSLGVDPTVLAVLSRRRG